MKQKASVLRFSLLQAVYWSFVCTVGSFATAMFLSEGYSASFIGMAALLYSCGGFLGQLGMGYVADRLHTNRGVYIGGALLTLPLAFGVCLLPWVWARLLCLVLVGVFQTPMAAVMDTWILSGLPGAEHKYGFVRACGSVGFALFSALYGMLLQRLGYGIMPWGCLLLGLVLIAMSCGIPDAVPAPGGDAPQKGRFVRDMRALLQKKDMLLLYLALFCAGVGIIGILNMLPALLQNVGGDVSRQGLTLMLAALLETVILGVHIPAFEKQPLRQILTGILMGIPALLGLGLAKTTLWVVICVSGRGISYSLCLLGVRKALLQMAPKGLETTAQSIADGAAFSLGPMCASLCCGVLLEHRGTLGMCVFSILFLLLALVFMLPVIKLQKKR